MLLSLGGRCALMNQDVLSGWREHCIKEIQCITEFSHVFTLSHPVTVSSPVKWSQRRASFQSTFIL